MKEIHHYKLITQANISNYEQVIFCFSSIINQSYLNIRVNRLVILKIYQLNSIFPRIFKITFCRKFYRLYYKIVTISLKNINL